MLNSPKLTVTFDSKWSVEHAEKERLGRGEHVESTARDQESQQPSAPPTWSRNSDVKVGQGQGRLETTHDYLVFFILPRIFIM